MVKRQLFLCGFKFVTLHVVSYLKFGLLPCMFLCRPIERDKLWNKFNYSTSIFNLRCLKLSYHKFSDLFCKKTAISLSLIQPKYLFSMYTDSMLLTWGACCLLSLTSVKRYIDSGKPFRIDDELLTANKPYQNHVKKEHNWQKEKMSQHFIWREVRGKLVLFGFL